MSFFWVNGSEAVLMYDVELSENLSQMLKMLACNRHCRQCKVIDHIHACME